MNNKNTLTLGSLFSGFGGFELAGVMAGIKPRWNSEVEPFAIAVTNKRFPNVKHYGDISRINGGEIEPVDIITGGFPCQSVSLAGRRIGVKHADHGDEQTTRSGLFFEATRIIKEMRDATNGKYPRYFIVENVGGLFSSNKGEDFRRVLEEILTIKDETVSVPKPPKGKWSSAGEIVGDDYSVAWRVLDAQYHGVPQRRKRIFLIADFDGGSAGKILFESESLPWYTPQSFSSGQAAAGGAGEGIKTAGGLCLNDQGGQRIDITDDITSTLRAKANHPPCVIHSAGFCTEHSEHSRSIGYEEEISPTLRAGVVPAAISLDFNPTDSRIGIMKEDITPTLKARMGTGGNQVNLVMSAETPKVYGICSKASNSQGGMAVVEGCGTRPSHHGDGYKESDVMYTLNTVERHSIAYGIDRATYNMGQNAQFDITVKEEVEPTMVAKGPGAVAHPVYSTSKNSHHTIAEKDLANTLVATDYKDPPCVTEDPYYIVRRLTPMECARLQGFPDWWCSNLGIENPTEVDLKFWRAVFETHRRVVTGAGKPKTDRQIIKWLKNPHSDSAEYRLWGNALSVPCAYYIMNGITDYTQSL